MRIVKLYIFWASISTLVSCDADKQNTSSLNSTIPSFTINNERTKQLQDCQNLFDLRVIELDQKTSVLAGGAVRDFIPFEDMVVLIDRYARSMTAVDFDGAVLWHLSSLNTPTNAFSSIFTARFNQYNKLIEVFDDNSFTVYRFNKQGEFVSKSSETISLLDRVSVNEEQILYDINFFPKAYLDEDGTAYDFAWSSNGVDIQKFQINNNYNPNYVAYVTHDNFSTVDELVYHHKNFHDTVNQVFLDSIVPVYTISFKEGESSQAIISNPRFKDRMSYIMKESVPFVMQSLPIQGKVFSTYRNGKKRGFAINGESREELLNAFYLKYGKEVFPAPLVCRNGYFMSILFNTQINQINEMKESPSFPANFSSDNISFFSPDSDLEKMKIFIFSPK